MTKSEKKEKIIEVGKKLIIEKGYRQTSVENITKEVGIAKGSFYTYFQSKDDLILYIVESKISEYKIKIEELLDYNLSFEDSLKKYIAMNINKPLEETEFFLFFKSTLIDIELFRKDIRETLANIIFSRNASVLKILKKYKKDIDASTEEELIQLSRIITGVLDVYFEKIFEPFLLEREKNISKLKEKIKNIAVEKEIEFSYKVALKILLK